MAEGTRRRTTPTPAPVHLLDPTRPPRPAPGCDVCAALDRQRAQAERSGNTRRAIITEDEIRKHPRHRNRP
ncbi:hypothetical protein DN051_43355 (plasmid) [Streptomyces cadmiisoli]|uniref:Uncharacterized protein n=1 Tax=Streptomyces cadmiisoli TaxID=2184053 RepID=A0A2Z4JE53_9ACTN|nr:hypothetical protein [Streptomyces sp. AS58]AWW43404.1 hypothetical protein DN051_43355 [Streptomyces cadmiisoli]